MTLSTGKYDREGTLIKEGDTLESMNYTYKVKYGDFTVNYTRPFPIKCLGFYIEYKEFKADKEFKVDSFAMLELHNIKVAEG